MAGDDRGLGAIEGLSLVIIGVFAAVMVLWVFSWLAGAIWWAIKIAVLITVLVLLVRWAFRRASR